MPRKPPTAGGRPETPAELIARITAEHSGGAGATGRHSAVAVLPARGRTRAARRAEPDAGESAGRHSFERPATALIPRQAQPAEPTQTSETARPAQPSGTAQPSETEQPSGAAEPSGATQAPDTKQAPERAQASSTPQPPESGQAPTAAQPRAAAQTSAAGQTSTAAQTSTIDGPSPGALPGRRRRHAAAASATQDTSGPGIRPLVRQLAPLAVGAVVVLLATFIAVTLRPEPNPQEPELSAALVDAEDPSVVRMAPDDVNRPTAPPPPAAPSASEDVAWTPVAGDEFTTGLSPQWTVYDDRGRSPEAVSVENGMLVIRGDAAGRTGGVAWTEGSRFGRWEMRARFPQGDPRYHPTLLLWPTDVAWPAGGEIDIAETASSSDTVSFFLHHGTDNAQLYTDRPLDITQWHDYAVEWTENRVTGYLDGQKWFESTDPATLPPGRMQAAVQLDWFPDIGNESRAAGPVAPTEMQVDHVRMYTAGRP